MITQSINLYRRLDDLQRNKWFKIGATVFLLAICASVFGSLLVTSYSLHAQRQAIELALDGQNYQDRDPHAVNLIERKETVVEGVTYQLNVLSRNPHAMLDENGFIAAPGYVAADLLAGKIPNWAPVWLLEQPQTTWMLAIIATAWVVLIVWFQIFVPFLLTLLGTLIPVALFWYYGNEQAMLAVGGVGLLIFTYVLLSRVVLALFSYPNQILAVAHTVVKEASRTRLSLVFIVLLLIALPLIPVFLDPEAPLRYRLQTFISRSLGLTYVIAACMTLFLACATVAFEIRDRQIWQLMTKPLNRFNYLMGKWLGVVSVNLILLAVAGVSIFTFVQYLRTTPVAPGLEGQLDVEQVQNEILTARQATRPAYDQLSPDEVRLRREQLIDRDPALAGREISLSEQREIDQRIRQEFSAAQRMVPPGRGRSLTFHNLHEAGHRNAQLTLRYRFHILRSDVHETFPAAFVINEIQETFRTRTYVPTMSHVLTIPPQYVRDDGSLTVTVFNLYEPPPNQQALGAIYFEEKDFELLYEVANFEGNFVRAVSVIWIKLAFLAMLGICCATFLSFSVACLFSFTIFMAGTLGPFLAVALLEYDPPRTDQMDWANLGMVIHWAFQSTIKLIAQGLVITLSAFGEFKPTQSLVEGRVIPWYAVGRSFLTLGVFWSGVSLLIGYAVMRSRQLAIYSGQG